MHRYINDIGWQLQYTANRYARRYVTTVIDDRNTLVYIRMYIGGTEYSAEYDTKRLLLTGLEIAHVGKPFNKVFIFNATDTYGCSTMYSGRRYTCVWNNAGRLKLVIRGTDLLYDNDRLPSLSVVVPWEQHPMVRHIRELWQRPRPLQEQ